MAEIYAIARSAGDGITDSLSNTNFPGLILLAIGALPMLFFLLRWLIKFQKEFTEFYIAENTKLRERVDELEGEVREKDETILSLKEELGMLKLTVAGQTGQIEHQTRQIDRLNGIIERRKADRDDGN